VADATQGSEPEGREIPAIYVNRFSIIVGPVTTRITFGEALTGLDAAYRSAVVMKTTDAEQLGQVLLATIQKNRERHAESVGHGQG